MPTTSPLEPSRSSSSMMLYSLLFVVAYVCGALGFGLIVEKLAPNQHGSLASIGHLLTLGSALLSGWLFAKRHQRLFSADETQRLIAYCICWIFLVDALSLASHPEVLTLPLPVLAGILAFGFGLDALIVWASFRYVLRKALIKYLPEPTSNPILSAQLRANQDKEFDRGHIAPAFQDSDEAERSNRRSDAMRPYFWGPLVALLVIVAAIVVLRARMVPTIHVTVADIPRVLSKVSTATRTPAFAAFVFTTPDRPNRKDAVNLQLSLENGHAGVDWVLLAPRNVEDKASFISFIKRRGYSFVERTTNGVAYLRIEDGDLAQLCADVVTKLYFRPRSEAMDLVVEGFEWDK
jgi:hypothetical protein